jgi:hypothetical protein
MVYHRRSIDVFGKLTRALLSGTVRRGVTVSEILDLYTDGFVARHYTREEFRQLLLGAGLEPIEVRVLGQRAEVVPLPGRIPLKPLIQNSLPAPFVRAVLERVGSFLFAIADKPALPS